MFLDEHFGEDEHEKQLQNGRCNRNGSSIARANDFNNVNDRSGTFSSVAP
jgi:hypothetical protein